MSTMITHLHPHKKFLTSFIGHSLLPRPVLRLAVNSGSALPHSVLVFRRPFLACDQFVNLTVNDPYFSSTFNMVPCAIFWSLLLLVKFINLRVLSPPLIPHLSALTDASLQVHQSSMYPFSSPGAKMGGFEGSGSISLPCHDASSCSAVDDVDNKFRWWWARIDQEIMKSVHKLITQIDGVLALVGVSVVVSCSITFISHFPNTTCTGHADHLRRSRGCLDPPQATSPPSRQARRGYRRCRRATSSAKHSGEYVPWFCF